MQITIRFGPTNEITKDVPQRTTVGNILSDRGIKAALGFGDNVQAVIDGQVQSADSPIGAGDVVTIETRANAKA